MLGKVPYERGYLICNELFLINQNFFFIQPFPPPQYLLLFRWHCNYVIAYIFHLLLFEFEEMQLNWVTILFMLRWTFDKSIHGIFNIHVGLCLLHFHIPHIPYSYLNLASLLVYRARRIKHYVCAYFFVCLFVSFKFFFSHQYEQS